MSSSMLLLFRRRSNVKCNPIFTNSSHSIYLPLKKISMTTATKNGLQKNKDGARRMKETKIIVLVALYYILGSRSFITSERWKPRQHLRRREKPLSPDQLGKVEHTREISHTSTQQPEAVATSLGSKFQHGRNTEKEIEIKELTSDIYFQKVTVTTLKNLKNVQKQIVNVNHS